MKHCREIVYDYAISLLLTPYKWGGDNPLDGLDCSQLVIELAMAIGKPPPYDMMAQNLYDYYLGNGGVECAPGFGSLVFFGKSRSEISHVGFCLNDRLMIEAGGGGSQTHNLSDATQIGAFVRIRPILRRSDLVATILPDWPNWDY